MSELSHTLGQQPIRTEREANSKRKKILHVLAVVAISLAGASIFTARVRPATMDYISYWSAGKLLLHHSDPYSPAAVLAVEKPLGFKPTAFLIWTPIAWLAWFLYTTNTFQHRNQVSRTRLVNAQGTKESGI